MNEAKPDPRVKGGTRFSTRIPEAHNESLQQAAREAGMSRSDYAAVLISRGLGLPEPSYVHRDRDQSELPIDTGLAMGA